MTSLILSIVTFLFQSQTFPANIYLFKLCSRKRCEICPNLTMKIPKQCQWLQLIFSCWCFYCYLWTYFTPFSSLSIVDFGQVNVSWVSSLTHIHDTGIFIPPRKHQKISVSSVSGGIEKDQDMLWGNACLIKSHSPNSEWQLRQYTVFHQEKKSSSTDLRKCRPKWNILSIFIYCICFYFR